MPACFMETLKHTPVVPVKNVYLVAKAMKACFRVTIDPQAGSLQKAKMHCIMPKKIFLNILSMGATSGHHSLKESCMFNTTNAVLKESLCKGKWY